MGHRRAISGVCRLQGDAGPQAGDSVIAELAERGFVSIETKGRKSSGCSQSRKRNSFGHDADDLARFAVDPDGAAHDGAIGAEAALPIVIAEHHRVGTAGLSHRRG